MEELLLQYHFTRSTPNNSFIFGKRYTAVIGGTGSVHVTTYTPKHKRFLDTTEYKTEKELEQFLMNSFAYR